MLWNAAQPYKILNGSEPTGTQQPQKMLSENSKPWTSLVVQWLRLCPSIAGGTGSVDPWLGN